MKDISAMMLHKSRLADGVWHGTLVNSPEEPDLVATLLGQELDTLTVTKTADDDWVVRLVIPPEAIADGVQTITITRRGDDTRLARIAVLAGEALSDDLIAEIDLLRAELDMLKQAFRRHCVETT